MPTLPPKAAARLLPVLFAAALFATPSAQAYPGGGAAFNGRGFDTCAAPSTSQMQAWWTNTPWSFVGVYIGGAVRACSQPNLTATWMNTTNMQGWVDQLAVAPAQASGVYGSACNSYFSDLATMARPPRFIWAANWDGNPSTSTLSCIAGSSWSNHQRLKQYQGDHNETYGGVTLNIDSNCANGPLAPAGGLNSASVCN